HYQAQTLLKIAKEGVAAEALVPVYPSKTFPNHYSIITGMTADHHGIVGNEFFDPDRKELFSISDATKVDGSWYQGVPLWNLAEHQGMVAASFFWPGSDANVQGHYPSFYRNYDAQVSNSERVAQTLNWLRLPEKERPHFITLYFSDADDAG